MMRRVGALVLCAVLWGSFAAGVAPARAAGSLKLATPLLLGADAPAKGTGSISLAVREPRAALTIAVSKLPPEVPLPLHVFVDDSGGEPTLVDVAEIDTLKKGSGKVTFGSADGSFPELDADSVDALVGRRVVVRDQAGAELFAAVFPAVEKFAGTKTAGKFAAADGSPFPKAQAKFAGVPSSKKGSEKFAFKLKGVPTTGTYHLHVEDAVGSGTFSDVGTFTGALFVRDTAKGQRLPLDLASLAAFVGRAFRIDDGAGNVIVSGTFPTALHASVPVRGVFIIDQAGNDDDFVLRLVGNTGPMYRTRVDLTQSSIRDLASDYDAEWEIVPVGSSKAGQIVQIRQVVKPNNWWQAARGASPFGQPEHYLRVLFSSVQPTVDDTKFVLHKRPKIGGHTTYQIESVLYPGEYLANEGHSQTGNGVLISADAIDITLR